MLARGKIDDLTTISWTARAKDLAYNNAPAPEAFQRPEYDRDDDEGFNEQGIENSEDDDREDVEDVYNQIKRMGLFLRLQDLTIALTMAVHLSHAGS